MELDLEPKIGMGPVRLGMTKQEVHGLLGAPSHSTSAKEVFLAGLFVHYDAAGTVEFIEAAESPRFTVLFKGINLHATPAADVVSLFSAQAPYDQDDPELGYSYIFKPLEVALWRGTMPESETDPEGQHFQAIGVGVAGYFSQP